MRSIERYLLGWMIGALGLGAVVIVLATYLVTLDEMNEVFDADLKNVAEALGTHHRAGISPGDPELPRSPARSDVADPAEIVITWTRDGRRVFSSDARVAIPFSGNEALTRIRIEGQDWIVYTDVSAGGVAQAAQRASARIDTARESALKIMLPMIALVVLVAALMIAALRRALRALDVASRDIATRSASSLTPIGLVDVPDEVAPLVASINGLMGRLSQAFTTQRRFLADAAHGLRTPMTALRLQLDWVRGARNDTERAQALDELQAGIERSQHVVEQLLHVARFEPDGEPARHDAVDLAELARAVVAAMSVKAEHLGIDLGAGASTPLLVSGDATQLSVLLDNLVENALRYTPHGGVVDVEAVCVDGRPTLRVTDNGPGIPEPERAQVFARFYRGEQASSLARDGGGSGSGSGSGTGLGLGLAIVRAIAQRHGAVVALHTPPAGRGLQVRVVFAEQPVGMGIGMAP